PSSHTLLLLCVMATAVIQIRDRVGSKPLRTVLIVAALVIMAVMVIGRLLSGVHWLTDIVGSIVLASALVLFYSAACKRYACRPKHRRH
ncbi:MAG: phosphatase PAP2 family protein, partial [Raoultibacter sp.]